MTRSWRLDDDRQTLVLASRDDTLARVVYWGARLPEDEDLDTLSAADEIDVTGGMLDSNPDLSICPAAIQSFPGQPGLVIADESGQSILPDFRYDSADAYAHRLILTFRDRDRELVYRATLEIHPEAHVIEARAQIDCAKPMRLNWLAAPVFPAPQLSDEMIDFTGRWCGEFQMARTAWSAGIRLRENRTGRTGHEHFPGVILPCRGATNTAGQAFAFHYGWSGGHRMVAEELSDGRRQVQFGHASGTETEPTTQFASATLFATYSDSGLNGCAVSFQRHLRERIVAFPSPQRPRPVHYNCWEAVYFNHDLPELKEIATRVAGLGAERFVLDDGWFGQRDDDTRSLGDWDLDPRKYPDGLTPLISHVHALGMSFGIWFEPEMINPDSDTFRAHPDWALGSPDQILGRQQMVLDMRREDVRAYLFDKISKVLSENDIDYIKWDHNRVLPVADAGQTRGTYALMDRLRDAFPAVEIESCASGGGRIDFGMLARTHRVWLSDSNDAVERLRMQHNAALFLPSVVTGSHVGPRTCHTSGRVIDIRFRAWVAAQRHMGFEMDPRELTEEEAQVLRDVTSWWKANRDWMSRADILRLDSADPAVIAEQQIDRQKEQFVVFAGKAATSAQTVPRPLQLTGLQPDRRYRVTLLNGADAPGLSRGEQTIKSGSMVLSGVYLMTHGVAFPAIFPDTMWVLEGHAL